MRSACLYFSSIDWNHTWQRPQQLALRLAEHKDVLFVEPLGLRRPRFRDLARLRRGFGAAHGDRPGVERCLRPFYLPWPGVPWIEALNGRLLARQLRRRLALRPPDLVWVGVPSRAVLEALQAWPGVPVVYDALDDFAAFHGGSAFVSETERRCVATARLTLATSAAIEERLGGRAAHVERLPNGADVELFGATPEGPGPADLVALPRPWVGYCGELGPWLDDALLAALARQRPDVSFVFLGPAVARPSAWRGLPNVHWLGPRPYQQVPDYVARFDVALLPFRPGPLTEAVNPIKVYEYLAVGLPIVATPLAELAPFGARGLVRLASREHFAAALCEALAEHDPGWRAARRLEAREHTWGLRAQRMFELFEAYGIPVAGQTAVHAGLRAVAPLD